MTTYYGRTQVVICHDNAALGRIAASQVAATLRDLLAAQDEVRIIWSAAESQESFFAGLCRESGIGWERIHCFNIDDFWDPELPFEYSCGAMTKRALYDRVQPASYHLVRHDAPDPEAEARRFAELLQEAPIDVVCHGIGRSGHLAMNEPGESGFDETEWVKVVNVGEISKQQCLDDDNFREFGRIPDQAITITIPPLLAVPVWYVVVPLATKKPILTRLAELTESTEELPASILIEKDAVLFVDRDSCPDRWLY